MTTEVKITTKNIWNWLVKRGLYVIGTGCLIIAGVLTISFKRTPWYISTIEIVGAISFGMGFCIQAWPILAKFGRTPYGKGLLALYHAIVLVLSGIPAKYMLAEALGLPSGDFPVTLAMWALLSYPAVWLIGTAFLGVVIYTFLLLTAALAEISTQPLFDVPLRFVTGFLPTESIWRQTISNGRASIFWKAFSHAIGSAAVSVAMVAVAVWWCQTIHQPRLVRLFAYKADYERAIAYPGVDPLPFRLHDNGVVSYATYQNGDVTIRVAHLK